MIRRWMVRVLFAFLRMFGPKVSKGQYSAELVSRDGDKPEVCMRRDSDQQITIKEDES